MPGTAGPRSGADGHQDLPGPDADVDGDAAGARAGTGRVLLVDAANVVGSRPTGWWRDRPGAARRLVDHLRTGTADGRLAPPVVVVVEGVARSGVAEGEADGVRVVHAAGSGDDELVGLAAAAAPTPVVLVSADRELRGRVAETGGTSVGPEWLHRRLARRHS